MARTPGDENGSSDPAHEPQIGSVPAVAPCSRRLIDQPLLVDQPVLRQQLEVGCVQRASGIDEIGAMVQGAGQGLGTTPTGDARMIARAQHLGDRPSPVVGGSGVLRVLQQTGRERLLDRGSSVAHHPGHQTPHRFEHDHRRHLATRQDVVTDGELVVHEMSTDALVDTLVAAAQQREPPAVGEFDARTTGPGDDRRGPAGTADGAVARVRRCRRWGPGSAPCPLHRRTARHRRCDARRWSLRAGRARAGRAATPAGPDPAGCAPRRT